jgi:hypothetical protein
MGTAKAAPHRCGGIIVYGAKVAVAIDEALGHCEGLRHAHERVVDGLVAVRMVLTEHVADNARALAKRPARAEAQVVHCEQDAPVHGLKPVSNVWKGASDDDGEGVLRAGGCCTESCPGDDTGVNNGARGASRASKRRRARVLMVAASGAVWERTLT